jgi:hypothetical protein
VSFDTIFTTWIEANLVHENQGPSSPSDSISTLHFNNQFPITEECIHHYQECDFSLGGCRCLLVLNLSLLDYWTTCLLQMITART